MSVRTATESMGVDRAAIERWEGEGGRSLAPEEEEALLARSAADDEASSQTRSAGKHSPS